MDGKLPQILILKQILTTFNWVWVAFGLAERDQTI